MQPIAIFDIVFFLASLLAFIILLKGWNLSLKRDVKLLLAGLLSFTLFYSLCLFFEWSGITKALEPVEDLIGALVPMWWAFLFYAFLQEMGNVDLKRSEEKYRTLFNESRDAIYITSREGKFLDVNPPLLELFGYTRDELISDINVAQIYVYPGDRVKFQKQIEQKESVRNYGVKFRKKSGEPIECLLTSTIRRSDDGSILGYQGIIRDITEQKQAEKALRESEAHYRAIVEAFDGLIYICSEDYRIEFMNDRFIERTGYNAIGETCYKALHDIDSICPWCVNDRVFKGETVHWEVQSPKDHRWYYIVDAPLFHDDGSTSKQAMILDITDRKEMEEALKASYEKIKLFAYSVSHDLKNPAIGIYGLTRLLQKNYSDVLNEKGRNYCTRILKAAEQIAALVEQINVYISAKEMPLTIERVKLKEVLNLVRDEFVSQFNIRQIQWSEPDIMPEISMDRLSAIRIFRNLVDNALKYGGEHLSEINVGYEESEAFHILSVTNNGLGIEIEDDKKIFGLFQRHDTSKGVSGTGLGLAIVRELAEQHGGKVWFESSLEQSTTFHVSILKKEKM